MQELCRVPKGSIQKVVAMENSFQLCHTKTMNTETIGQRVRRHRQDKNMTQSQLAQALRVSDKTVYNWEGERETPNAAGVRALAAFFGVDHSEFLTSAEEESLKAVIEKTVGETTQRPLDEREKRAIALIDRLRTDPDRFDIWLRDGEMLTGGKS